MASVSFLCARMSPSIRSDGSRGVEVLMLSISDSPFCVDFVLFKQGVVDASQHLFGIHASCVWSASEMGSLWFGRQISEI